MGSKVRFFTKRFFIIVNVGVAFFLLLSWMAAYLNPMKWWFISFFSLAFPFMLGLSIVFVLGWLLLRKWRLALISIVTMLICIKGILVFFAFKNPAEFKQKKDPRSIRVVSWNVARFIELKRNSNKGSQTRLKMMDLIRAQDADIICLQEFHTSIDSGYYNNIVPIQQMGYPHFYFSFDLDGDNHYYSSIIFSRFPIIDSAKIRYPRPTLPDALIHADIKWGNDTIRIYTTHLQSIQFGKRDYDRISKLKSADDSMVENSRNILAKIKRGFTNRSLQADVIEEVLVDSPHPVILCADLNDVPNSYTYTTVRGNMQDAFLKKGFGIGRTYSSLSPTLRIDYIFADNSYRVQQFNRVLKKYSDHYMLVADIQIKNPRPVK